MPSKHFPWGPSGAERHLACSASVARSKGLVSHDSPYAQEGTLAHSLCEECLRKPDEALEIAAGAPDDEMRDAVLVFVDQVQSLREEVDPLVEEGIEETIESEDFPDFGGTPDYWITYGIGEETVLQVIDFKYGAGIAVDAEGNVQLGEYALLVREKLNYEIDKVYLTVVQPRTETGVSVWECPDGWLDALAAELKMAQSVTTVESGSHCRFCPAIHVCEEYREELLVVAEQTFDHVASLEDIERWEKLYAMKKSLSAYFEKIRDRLVHEATVNGVQLEKFVVRDSLSHAKWTKDMPEDTILRKIAAKKDDHGVKINMKPLQETKLKSPTQLRREGFGDQIEEFVVRKVVGKKLVEIKRGQKAVEPPAAAVDALPDLSFLE